jgi:2,4-dienoyl-CoA reductase-like NADH-dependent reductase (Old Yellow Enzyme family)
MSILFTKARIGSMEIPNRIIRTASHEGLADARGRPTPKQLEFYQGFIDGGVGLVITGYAGISQAGKSALFHMTMIDSDDLTPYHRRLVEGDEPGRVETRSVHKIGGKIVLQIAHCGRQTWSSVTGKPLQAPSAEACGFYRERPDEMTVKDIKQVTGDFARAAKRAKKAGYDGVQIHAAHGYLLSSFLSRCANRRRDDYGGGVGNRFRIVRETLEAVRQTVGPDYPVLIKLNTYEKARKGTKPDDCIRFAKLVDETGCCDAVEFSCGTNEGGFTMARGRFPTDALLKYMRPYCDWPRWVKLMMRYALIPCYKLWQPSFSEGYNLDTAARAKREISLPVIAVGGMRSRRFMEQAIEEGKADFVSMARPLIREPDLPNKFKAGTSEGAVCDNCNDCVVATDTQQIKCYKQEEPQCS